VDWSGTWDSIREAFEVREKPGYEFPRRMQRTERNRQSASKLYARSRARDGDAIRDKNEKLKRKVLRVRRSYEDVAYSHLDTNALAVPWKISSRGGGGGGQHPRRERRNEPRTKQQKEMRISIFADPYHRFQRTSRGKRRKKSHVGIETREKRIYHADPDKKFLKERLIPFSRRSERPYNARLNDNSGETEAGLGLGKKTS